MLQAVSAAYVEGYALPVLVGDKTRIRAAAEAEHIDITPFEIVPVDNDEEAAAKAVWMVHDDQADVVMKGLMDSSMFLRAVLNKEYGLRKSGASMSAIAVAELRKLGRLVFITDPGIMAGTAAPAVFCSRADSAEAKKNTLAMALYLASQKGADA